MSHHAFRILLSVCASAAVASAQIITWGPVLPSVAPSDVSTNGTLVFAGNSHGPGTPIGATVNGVAFTGGFQPLDWNGYITTGLNGSTTGNAEYDKLLNGSRAMQNAQWPVDSNPTPWGGIRLDTLATLNAGYAYEIQVWFTDQRLGSPTNVLYDRVMTLSSAWGTATVVGGAVTNVGSMLQGPLSGPMDADPDNAPAIPGTDTVFGTHCTGVFTYVPGAETWLLIQGSHPIPSNVLQPHITALQIRDLSSAHHSTYGTGCYAINAAKETFYEKYTNSALASARLQGNVLQLIPSPPGYFAFMVPGAAGTTYLPPSGGATLLNTSDDGADTITPSLPVPSPFGAATQVTISHNGIITLGASPNQPGDYQPAGADVAASTGTAFYSWHDFNDAESGSGRIKYEEVAGVLYVTWDGVEGYQSGTNPHTFQYQIDLASGVVTMVWQSVNVVSLAGREWLTGYTDAGTSMDPGSIDLSTALPLQTGPDVTLQPLALSASPAPTYTIGNPSVPITYTASNMID
ncbi:MAG: hypothetical protein JNK78_20080, partial [Planctomycetes bacterium]|nr:hypothetical protein [Planctomycetota bacterium]